MDQIIVTHLDGSTMKLQSKEKVSAITRATQTVELLGADTIDLTVESASKLSFYIGDKISIIGRDYTLNTPVKERKISEAHFIYEVQFEGVQYDLLRAGYNVNVDTTSNEIQDINGDSLTGDLKRFLDVLISNVNRVFPGKWSLGSYLAGTETRTETFSDTDNCLSVLQSLCSEDKYNTEFLIEIDGSGNRILNVGPVGEIFPFTFEYGKGKGIYDLTRQKVSSSNIITRLNVFGSSKNINTSKYRASKLCLPSKNKAQSFLESAAAKLKYGVWENTKTFEDVFPHRTGTISSLGDSELKFIDSSMDFDLNEKEVDGITTKYLINGNTAKIHFNSGNLAGYEFEITEYNHSTKQFTLISQTDENGYTFPSPTSAAFQFGIGDKYVILDIVMPQTYIDAAESELQDKGQDFLDKYSQPNVSYGLTVDSFFLKNIVEADPDTNIIWVGDYIPIKDTDLEVDKSIRVKGFTRELLKDYSYSLTIADLPIQVSLISRVISDLNGIDKVIKINNLNDPAKARRNYLSAQEVLNMVFDPEGDFYSDKIKPLSIDTTMLSVGSKSMQFGLTETFLQPNYGGAKNRIIYNGGVITHYAILDESSNPRIWNIADGDITLATDAAYYIYVKCQRVGAGATILFSTDKILVESDGAYYHFLIGIINSVGTNNERSVALMYGFSTINGRFIKTGRISSADGNTYFDLDAGEFKGAFKFSSGTSIETAISNSKSEAISEANDFTNTVKADLQSQIDGNITSWFFDYEPNLTNVPASNWSSDAVKDIHLGDLFYWTSKGYSYRFQKVGSVYSWTRISDTDVTKALADAAVAKDTADSKRRVFVSQPVPPYDLGDLWSQGATGDLMKCISPRASGIYYAADWEKASKYTDDTAVNNLQVGGRNLLQNSASERYSGNEFVPEYITSLAIANLGKQIVFSFDLKADIPGAVQFYSLGGYRINTSSVMQATTSWKRYAVPAGEFSFSSGDPNGDQCILSWYGTYGTGINPHVRNIKIELGNKATDYTPAPEDVSADATAKANAAQAAAQEYALAKANLAEVTAKAYADGIVTDEETRAIADATAKANAAQANAISAAAADATSKVSNIKIGGRNLYLNGAQIISFNQLYLIPIENILAGHIGEDVAISFELKSSVNSQIIIYPYQGAGITIADTIYRNIYTSFVKYELVTKVVDHSSPGYSGYLGIYDYVGANDMQIRNIKIELGNKVTDFTPAPEDIDAKIAEADYLKEALQGSTDISGGLLATNVLLMKNGAGAVTGGFSGNSDDNVGMWTGGTYADAIAGLAKNILFKNGSFRLANGDVVFDIEQLALTISALIRTSASGERVEISKETNSITIFDVNNVARMKFAPKNVLSFADIGGNVTTTTTTFAAHSNYIDTPGSVNIGSNETLVLDPTKYYDITTPNVNYEISAIGYYDGLNKIHYVGTASVTVQLIDTIKNTVVWSRTKSVSSGTTTGQLDGGTIAAATILAMSGSTYRIDVILTVTSEGNGSGGSSEASIASGQTLSGTTMVNFSEMGLNGFNFINDSGHFLHYGPDIFAYKGIMDFPGVLAAGSVTVGATHINKWGAKVASSSQAVTKGGTGIYNVPHNLGTTEFALILTPSTDNIIARITSKSTNSFQVTCKNMSGIATDAGFDYVMIGSN